MTHIHVVPTLEDNYTYVITSSDMTVLVDCGESAPVIDFLLKHNLTPDALLVTHHHGDHIAGIPSLKDTFPEMTIYAPEKDRARIHGTEIFLNDGDILNLGDVSFRCIETPGHTLNHLCFHAEKLNALFSGDTLFSMGCGRLFEGTPEQMFHSLQILKALPIDTMIYAGHEYTKKNAEFALSVEPQNAAISARFDEVLDLRARNLPTLPVSLAREMETNVFLMAQDAKNFALLRQKRDNF